MDVLGQIEDGTVHCCVTSPPYWGLRSYLPNEHPDKQCEIGSEPTPESFVRTMVNVFREVRRVLHPTGVCFLNLGDSYSGSGRGGYPTGETGLVGTVDGQHSAAAARVNQKMLHSKQVEAGAIGRKWTPVPAGLKPKDLCLIPWRVVIALQDDGWYVRSVIAWTKPAPMPESCNDRPTNAWEPIFLLAKNDRYFYDTEAVREKSIGNETSWKHSGGWSTGADRTAKGWAQGDKKKRNVDRPAAVATSSSRNQRNVWNIAAEPFPGSHFACFPTEIPRRAIKAGTSLRGCCPECLAPFVRVTNKQKLTRKRPNAYTKRTGEDGTGNSCANDVAGVEVKTLGWRPGCKHPKRSDEWREDLSEQQKLELCDYYETLEAIPCTVLDPFTGSGTTGQVAAELGRSFVGAELNPEYIPLIEQRVKPEAQRQSMFSMTGSEART